MPNRRDFLRRLAALPLAPALPIAAATATPPASLDIYNLPRSLEPRTYVGGEGLVTQTWYVVSGRFPATFRPIKPAGAPHLIGAWSDAVTRED